MFGGQGSGRSETDETRRGLNNGSGGAGGGGGSSAAAAERSSDGFWEDVVGAVGGDRNGLSEPAGTGTGSSAAAAAGGDGVEVMGWDDEILRNLGGLGDPIG